MSVSENEGLHSAEHIFARSLQNLGEEIHVRKADTFSEEKLGKIFIKENLDAEKVFVAEADTNKVINSNLKVNETMFDDLNKAIKRFPKLRFNEERLEKEKTVRVISIGDFDFSACIHKHVKTTKEILAFSICNISHLRGETEIRFLSGLDAILFAIDKKNDILRLSLQNGFNPERLSDEYSRLKGALKEEKDNDIFLLESLLNASNMPLDMGNMRISDFYRVFNKFIKESPGKDIAVVSSSQIFVLAGEKSGLDIKRLSEEMKRIGFVGEARQRTINGKINDKEKALKLLRLYIRREAKNAQ